MLVFVDEHLCCTRVTQFSFCFGSVIINFVSYYFSVYVVNGMKYKFFKFKVTASVRAVII